MSKCNQNFEGKKPAIPKPIDLNWHGLVDNCIEDLLRQSI